MRNRSSTVAGKSAYRLLLSVSFAALAAGCSSDVYRFQDGNYVGAQVQQPYQQGQELTTASVGGNGSMLAPMRGPAPGAVPRQQPIYAPPQNANLYPRAQQPYPQQPYPQAIQQPYNAAQAQYGQAQQRYQNAQNQVRNSAQWSQPFPAAPQVRSPQIPTYDPTLTGSIPAGSGRVAASPVPLYVPPTVKAPEPVQSSALAPATPAVQLPPKPVVAAPQAVIPAAPQPVAVRPVQPMPVAPQQQVKAVPAPPVQMQPDPIVTGTARPVVDEQRESGWTTTGGTRITVRQNETIYNLSRRFGVPASEIMKANGISDATKVTSGQQLIIPNYVYGRSAPVSAPDSDPNTRAANASTGLRGEASPDRVPIPTPKPQFVATVAPASLPKTKPVASQATQQALSQPMPQKPQTPVVPAAKPLQTASAGGYTVVSGDSLSKIAGKTGVSVDALKQANGLSGTMIKVGQSLRIPAGGTVVAANQVVPDRSVQTGSIAPSAGSKPTAYTPPKVSVTEATRNADPNATAPKATGIGKLRWPAKGQVITGFGDVNKGVRNDGIDITLPEGSAVKSAENGVVIYSGNGLKDYGNTVLVRHDDGLVTVYAHAKALAVKRGDKVVRGQTLAYSGMSGTADRPKLHFEVRKDATPVNPMSYLN